MTAPDIKDSIDRMLDNMAGHRRPPRPPAGPGLPPEMEGLEVRGEGPEVPDAAESVREPGRRLRVLDKADVVVVGAGPAGLAAALAARRAGADVILLERYGCFGGVITTVGMETIAWYRYQGCSNDSEGIGQEMERLAAAMGASRKFPYNDSQCLDADFFKVVADKLIMESGVRPILHCLVVEVLKEGQTVTGVITESKSGRMAVLGSRVIDASGDADVAWLAGAAVRKTPRDQMMGVTTVFNAAGVDVAAFRKYAEERGATYADWSSGEWEQETTGKEDALPSPYLQREFEEAKRQGVLPASAPDFAGSWSSLTAAGEATNLNLAHQRGIDCTDVRDLTRAEIAGRHQALLALTALKAQVPGFENAKLRNFGMTLGTRDSRKIIGRYNLTEKDVKEQARFEDSIGIFPEFIDGYSVLILPTSGRYFQVPLGCCLPLNVENLLVAGRCVAGDKISHCAMRNMMACTVTGLSRSGGEEGREGREALVWRQGAGVAAAVSLRVQASVSATPLPLIQEELHRQGVRTA